VRDWADEPFRKLYTRDNADMAAMPYQAKSLLWNLLRVMDGAGLLALGRLGLDSLPVIFRAEGEDARLIRGAVEYLLGKDPVLKLVDRQGRKWLFWPNMPTAQAAAASDKARKQAQRERDRALANAAAMGLDETTAFLHGGQQGDLLLGDGAEGAAVSRAVTPGHDQIRSEEIRIEEEEVPEEAGELEDDLPVLPDGGGDTHTDPPKRTAEPDPGELLQRLWNEITKPPIPRWPRMTEARRRAARARWLEEPREGYWRAVMERIQASAFCRGENDRGWKATPAWFLKPESHVRAMEGMYDAREGAGSAPKAQQEAPKLRVLKPGEGGKLYG
jgi:hypothetical protein